MKKRTKRASESESSRIRVNATKHALLERKCSCRWHSGRRNNHDSSRRGHRDPRTRAEVSGLRRGSGDGARCGNCEALSRRRSEVHYQHRVRLDVIEATLRANVVAIPGALTPSEVIACWKAGADFVKIFPVASVGGDLYVRSLKLPLPHIELIAAGGMNQQNAIDFIVAGSTALGVGSELLPKDAILEQQDRRIHELARRFLGFVSEGRAHA